jgi:hypothetical protein
LIFSIFQVELIESYKYALKLIKLGGVIEGLKLEKSKSVPSLNNQKLA